LFKAIEAAGNDFIEMVNILKAIQKEANIPFYYNLHSFKGDKLPKSDEVIKRLKKAGYESSRTQFEVTGIKVLVDISSQLNHNSRQKRHVPLYY
jgi:tRNA G26 N,N-dimethylase Trm1